MNWKILTGILLITLSVAGYLIHYVIFRDTRHIFLYLIGDLAFLPIQVLLVTLIIERLLNEREKLTMLKKLNMLIGTFYSEVGTHLMGYFFPFIAGLPELHRQLLVREKWTEKDFSNAINYVRGSELKIECRKVALEELREFLENKRHFLLGLMSNPNLFEHDAFTDMLWAAFHLSEELSARNSLEGLPETDYTHLSYDMKRVFTHLFAGWLAYMKHLKQDYPYLFSLAVRTNPLDADAKPVVYK